MDTASAEKPFPEENPVLRWRFCTFPVGRSPPGKEAAPRFPWRSGEVPAREASDGGPLSASDLSAMLWRERTLLVELIGNLERMGDLLEHGSLGQLPHATQGIGQIIGRLRLVELGRSVEASVVSAEWGAQDDATLTGLASQAPTSVWADIFGAHHVAMTEHAHRILALAEHNHATLAGPGLRARNEGTTIQTHAEPPTSPSQQPEAGTGADYCDPVLHQALIQGAQAVNLYALPKTLQEFLRIPGTTASPRPEVASGKMFLGPSDNSCSSEPST